MRRLVVLAIVSLLGIAPIGIVGRSASAQETPTPTEQLESCVAPTSPEQGTFVRWQGVCEPIPLGQTIQVPPETDEGFQQVFQAYAVKFVEEFAATQEIGGALREQEYDAEFMVVYVREGTFALDLAADGAGRVLVSSLREEIPTLSEYSELAPHYTIDGKLTNADSSNCVRACPVEPGMRIQLQAGDVALAEEKTICIWCLLNSGEEGFDDEVGHLDVYVLQDAPGDAGAFSWILDWKASEGAFNPEPSQHNLMAPAPASDRLVALGWALFNPGGRCDHG